MPKRDLVIGETYEDELNGSQWTDVRGKKQPWGEIAFDLSAIVLSVPIDDWKPTSQDMLPCRSRHHCRFRSPRNHRTANNRSQVFRTAENS